MLSRRTLILTASAGFLASCGEAGNVRSGEVFNNASRDAIFAMRIRTYDHHALGFTVPPFDRTSGASASTVVKHGYSLFPECADDASRNSFGVCRPWYSAFVVNRVPSGDYHIQSVFQQAGPTQVQGSVDPGKAFPKRFAFRLVPGRVNYLGDFLIEFGGRTFRLTNAESGIERARAYLQNRYPKITADVVANYPAPRTGPA